MILQLITPYYITTTNSHSKKTHWLKYVLRIIQAQWQVYILQISVIEYNPGPVRSGLSFQIYLRFKHFPAKKSDTSTSCRRRVQTLKATATFDCFLPPLSLTPTTIVHGAFHHRRRSSAIFNHRFIQFQRRGSREWYSGPLSNLPCSYSSLKAIKMLKLFSDTFLVFFFHGSRSLSSTRLRLGVNQPRRWKPNGGSSHLHLNSLRSLRSKAWKRKTASFSQRCAWEFSRLFGRKSRIQSKSV